MGACPMKAVVLNDGSCKLHIYCSAPHHLLKEIGRMTNRLLRSGAALALLLLLIPLAACESRVNTLRLHMPLNQQFDPASVQIIFTEQSGLHMAAAPAARGMPALEALVDDAADLSLLENSTAFVTGVRAVLPVYQSVLHVLMRDGFVAQEPSQPLRGASIHVIAQSVAGDTFVDLITRRQGLDAEDFQLTGPLQPGQTDIIVYFGPIDPAYTPWYRVGYQLVSPGELLSPGGKLGEGRVGYVAPNMKPWKIPAFTYDLPGNDQPLLTVAVDTLLVTRKEVPAATIYELTRTLLEQKPRFTAVAPQLFGGINESFDPLDLSFPLHAGARRYLERDEPSLLERYAESINMLVYVTFLFLTGFLALARWRDHRKKDRVDVFYQQVLAVRDRIGAEPPQALLDELNLLERDAFSALINERLAADESFRIFTDLLAHARAELKGLLQQHAGPARPRAEVTPGALDDTDEVH